jgi:small subunit ribosomal protein S16
MSAEDAELKFRSWVDEKEAKISARVKATADERKQRAAEISGARKKVEKKKADEQPDELLNVNLEEMAAKETAADESPAEESVPEEVATDETAAPEEKE